VLHATIRIGNATLEIDEAYGEFSRALPCMCMCRTRNAVYAQALRAGATSIETPQNKEYGDRSAE